MHERQSRRFRRVERRLVEITGAQRIVRQRFESLGPDSFVVFSGVYDDQAAAEEALADVRDQAGGGSTRKIVPEK